jgi:maltooligosyltrehalose trehalohydrolase
VRPAVWAPDAARVELVLDDGRHPMQPGEGGWWESSSSLEPGSDYRFSLDGGEPLPDPRSSWQPAGVHGPSRSVEHSAFEWSDAGFAQAALRDAIVYELHIGTFTPSGTFEGAIERLDALVELGVTHLELMPVAEFSGDRGWGYDGVDLFAPHHAYGGPEGLKRLVDAAHRRGLGVLLDVVYNHLGPDGNYLGRFGPYVTDRYETPWGDAINVDDAGSHEVRRFVVDNALMWMRDYHVDGLRLDAVHAVFDSSAVHILEEIATATSALSREVRRPMIVTAESNLNDPRLVRPVGQGGYALDAVWADDVHHALHVALTGETAGYYADFTDPGALGRAIGQPFLYTGDYSVVRDRLHGRDPGELPGDRFIACIQNHDQVGNRAVGDRIAHLVSPGRARIAAAILLTAPYVPLLFAGEEWAASSPFQYFTGHDSPELAEAVRLGRRQEFTAFGWDPDEIPDPQERATFERSKLHWEERDSATHAEMLAWYRSLIALRRATPALRDADRFAVRVAADQDGGWISITRGPIEVLVNLGVAAVERPMGGTPILCWPPDLRVEGGTARVPPDGVLVARHGR